MNKVKLAVKKEPGFIPCGGFHYLLHPLKMEREGQEHVFELMGYVIIEVSEADAERLTKAAISALNHQIEVAMLTEKTLQNALPVHDQT